MRGCTLTTGVFAAARGTVPDEEYHYLDLLTNTCRTGSYRVAACGLASIMRHRNLSSGLAWNIRAPVSLASVGCIWAYLSGPAHTVQLAIAHHLDRQWAGLDAGQCSLDLGVTTDSTWNHLDPSQAFTGGLRPCGIRTHISPLSGRRTCPLSWYGSRPLVWTRPWRRSRPRYPREPCCRSPDSARHRW